MKLDYSVAICSDRVPTGAHAPVAALFQMLNGSTFERGALRESVDILGAIGAEHEEQE